MLFPLRHFFSKRNFKLFQIEPTMRCNVRCSMCPWHEMRAHQEDMAWDTFLAISRSFPQVQEVDLTGGGEPLLHPRLLEMAAMAKENRCKVGFSTNATLLSEELSRELVKLKLDWIEYSIDGATAQTYEKIRRGAVFSTVLSHVARMNELRKKTKPHRPATMLFFVMMRDNIHELPLMVDLCVDMGIDKLIAKNLDVILSMEHDAQRLFQWDPEQIDKAHQDIVRKSTEKARQRGLFMRVYNFFPKELTTCVQDPLHSVFFNWEGYVSPCITLCYAYNRVFQGTWRQSPILRFGSINEAGFDDIWQSEAYRSFRQPFEKRRAEFQRRFIQSLVAEGSQGVENAVPSHPLPEGCRLCHYMYGV